MELIIKKPTIKELLIETEKLVNKAKNFLYSQGKVVELDKYLTIKNYCIKYNIKDESVVTNWIRRGIIKPEDIHIFSELNGLRMVKDKEYK
jgi:hypothetical protein